MSHHILKLSSAIFKNRVLHFLLNEFLTSRSLLALSLSFMFSTLISVGALSAAKGGIITGASSSSPAISGLISEQNSSVSVLTSLRIFWSCSWASAGLASLAACLIFLFSRFVDSSFWSYSRHSIRETELNENLIKLTTIYFISS